MVSGNIGVESLKKHLGEGPELEIYIVSLNETPEFPFWRHSICVGFDFNEIQKMENLKK